MLTFQCMWTGRLSFLNSDAAGKQGRTLKLAATLERPRRDSLETIISVMERLGTATGTPLSVRTMVRMTSIRSTNPVSTVPPPVVFSSTRSPTTKGRVRNCAHAHSTALLYNFSSHQIVICTHTSVPAGGSKLPP